MPTAHSELLFFMPLCHLWPLQKRHVCRAISGQFFRPSYKEIATFNRFYFWRWSPPCPMCRRGLPDGQGQDSAGWGKAAQAFWEINSSVQQPEALDQPDLQLLSTTQFLVFWLLRINLEFFSSFSPPGNLKCVRRKEISTIIVRNETKITCHHQTPVFFSPESGTQRATVS